MEQAAMLSAIRLCLLVWVCSLAALASPGSLKLVQWTDIHAGGPSFVPEAVDKAVTEGLASEPQVVLLTGDNCDNSYGLDTFQQRFREFVAALGGKLKDYPGAIIFSLGNDDFKSNYQSLPEELEATYQDMRAAFGDRYYLNVLGNGVCPQKPGGLTFISLNSQLFCSKNAYPKARAQADLSFQWLRQQLKAAEPGGRPVVVVFHIPPSGDLYTGTFSWRLETQQQLQDVLAGYPHQVVILCGHFHRNHVQAMAHPHEPAVILTSGALARKYDYSSNWRQYNFQFDEAGEVGAVDYTVHYPLHREWDSHYRVVPRDIQHFFDTLTQDPGFYMRYFSDIYGHHRRYREWAAEPAKHDTLLEQFWVKRPTLSE